MDTATDTSEFRREVVAFGNVYFDLHEVNSVQSFQHKDYDNSVLVHHNHIVI